MSKTLTKLKTQTMRYIKRVSIILVLLVLSISISSAATLIANPGFENGSTTLSGWGFTTKNGITPVWDSTGAHTGTKSVKISIPGTTDQISGEVLSNNIPSTSGTRYTFAVWGKSQGVGGTNNPAVRAAEYDKNHILLRQTDLHFPKGTVDWNQMQTTFTTGANTAYIGVYANIWEGYGTFWVDDVSLTTTTSTTTTQTLTPTPTFTPTSNPPQTQSPYGGTPRSIPGTIQAEDFDNGGEGIAYHDLDSVNQGGQYRLTEGVDIESTTDTGAGYNVGWIESGEWLEYTTTVSTTGTYTIETRVASDGTGGTFHIEFNGIDKTGPITIPNTGGYQNWQTLSKTVTLNTGQQVMKIVMDTDGPGGNVGNLNYIRIASSTSTPPTPSPSPQTQSPYGGTPRSIPGTIQAEDFDNGGEGIAYHDLDSVNQGGQYRPTEGVDIESTTDTGAGNNIGWIQSGEWLEYTTTVSTTGTYSIETGVASNGNGGTFHIEFNGIDKTGPLTIPNTGGWQNWQTLSKTVTLNSGQQVMKIVMDTNGATGNVGNLNYIRIISSTSTPSPTLTITQTPTPTQTPTQPPASIQSTTPTPTSSPIVSGAFYVATNGNDANSGTESQPWRTIQKAANTLTAGQTVYVKSGTYNERVNIQNSGSAGKYITFSAYPGQTPIIDGTGISMGSPPDGGLIQINGKSYIKITGFRIQNSAYSGFYVSQGGGTPSNHIEFIGNYLYHTWAAAILMYGGHTATNAVDFVADGNTLDQSHYSDDPAAHEGLSIGGGLDGFRVSNNIIKNSLHGGIDAKDGAWNGQIYGNTCTTTTFTCLYVDAYGVGAGNIDVYNNVVHDMLSAGETDIASGFNMGAEQGGAASNIRVYNNLVYNNYGVAVRINHDSGGTVDNILISSNTFYNNGIDPTYAYERGGISIEASPTLATNVIVRNNIISQNAAYQIKNQIGSNAVISNNLIDGYRGFGSETYGQNYLTGSPNFINAGSLANFRLNSNSVAIDHGSTASFVPSADIVGTLRPQGAGADIGAYEYKP